MPRRSDFYPPLLSPGLVRACQAIAPLYGQWRHRMTLQIDPSCVDTLARLRGDRLLLLPNHPTYYDDWLAVFILSAQLKTSFFYLAAHERFGGLEGHLIQRLGAYSIRRGLGDRPSVAMTRDLLTRPKTHLVIFPEGGCSYQNDTVMPFRVGAVQVAMQALSKLDRTGEPLPNLYAVPLSLKYRYTTNMVPVIDKTLKTLETALRLPPLRTATFYERLRRVAEHVMVNFEQIHALPSDVEGLSWNDRIARLRNHFLEQCESRLNIVSTPTKPLRERVYKIQYVLEEQAETLAQDDFWTYDSIHQIASTLLNFDAIYDGYVATSPTPERFLDTLIRLERYVFRIDYPPPKAHRRLLMRVGEPINLKHHYEDYLSDRSATVNRLTRSLQDTVQTHLNQLAQFKA